MSTCNDTPTTTANNNDSLEIHTTAALDNIGQKYVLAVLYYNTGRDNNRIDNDNWLSSEDDISFCD